MTIDDAISAVSDVLKAGVYFDVNLDEVERELDEAGEFEARFPQPVMIGGGAAALEARLNIRTSAPVRQAWTVTVKMTAQRVAGVDYEGSYSTADGTKKSGWHRHVWDGKSAERNKVEVDGLDDVSSRRQFLQRAFSMLGVQLNRQDHGSDELPLGE